MIRLPLALQAWHRPDFRDVLKAEVERLGSAELPLQQGLASSSHVVDNGFSVMIIGVADEPACIRVRAGVFYSGIVAGCNCADDPTPVEPQNEYCEVVLAIDKATAQTSVALLGD